jgi:hypothetical protein
MQADSETTPSIIRLKTTNRDLVTMGWPPLESAPRLTILYCEHSIVDWIAGSAYPFKDLPQPPNLQ